MSMTFALGVVGFAALCALAGVLGLLSRLQRLEATVKDNRKEEQGRYYEFVARFSQVEYGLQALGLEYQVTRSGWVKKL
jgi:hypothetical protein